MHGMRIKSHKTAGKFSVYRNSQLNQTQSWENYRSIASSDAQPSSTQRVGLVVVRATDKKKLTTNKRAKSKSVGKKIK